MALPCSRTGSPSVAPAAILPNGQFLGATRQRRQCGGVTLVDSHYSAGTQLKRHHHASAYFCWIRSGHYDEQYGQQTRTCRPGMVVFHPAGESHSERFGNQTVASFNVELNAEWQERTALCRDALEETNGPLAYQAQRLWAEFRNFDTASPLAIEAILLEMAVANTRNGQSQRPPWLDSACEAMQASVHLPLQLSSIAQQVGVEPARLAQAFRRHLRQTPGDYLRHLRVERASLLLATTELPVVAVAADCGFADQSHLTRWMRRIRSITPAQLRSKTETPYKPATHVSA